MTNSKPPITLLHPENSFFWHTKEDICYIPESDTLGKISAPLPSSKSARKYIISDPDSQFVANRNESRERLK